MEASYPQFESKAPPGQLQGFDIDIGNAVCQRLQVKCVWVENSFDGLITALEARFGPAPKNRYGLQRNGMSKETIKLGAGIVGVSVALHLQARGVRVALVDRRAPGEETSFGNAGLIEVASGGPYGCPRDWRMLLRLARNDSTMLRYDVRSLPACARWLATFWYCGQTGDSMKNRGWACARARPRCVRCQGLRRAT